VCGVGEGEAMYNEVRYRPTLRGGQGVCRGGGGGYSMSGQSPDLRLLR